MKKSGRKFLGLVLSFALCISMLAGCGADKKDNTVVRIGALKGPTTLGLLFLQDKIQKGEASVNCEISMMTAADELLPLMIKGELDIALLPANVAGVLYQKTNGAVCVIDINTLGVLYMVSADDTITEPADLAGKTIYVTGKGTTPDYALQYLLEQNGLTTEDCNISYKSEATEIVTLLSEDTEAVGLLPQPFVTVACAQNEALSVVLDMNAEWEKAAGDTSSIVTGVTVVRNEFLAEHAALVADFLKEHAQSTEAVNNDVETGAALAVEAGIIVKEPIAKKAIPACNITCITGEKMKETLSGYLQVLYELNPESVGGALPEEEFYYIGE